MAKPPIAPKRPYAITQHGRTRIDDYYWLRNREDPTVTAYLQAENEYVEEMMAHTRPLQDQIFSELKGRLKEDDTTVPERRGDYFYYERTEAGKQYPYFCRKHGSLDAPEEILLDQNALVAGRAFGRMGAFAVSPDQQKLAYSVDLDGTEKCVLYIKDLGTGALYPEQITNTYGNVYTHGGVEWAGDSHTLFYVRLDEALRPYQLYRHNPGHDPALDPLVYHETDETFFLFLGKTRSQAYLTLFSLSTTTHEWQILPAAEANGEFEVFEPRRTGVEYQIDHLGDYFYIATNEDAQNFRLMKTAVGSTRRAHWQEVVPHRQETLIDRVEAFAGYLVLFERREGLKQIRIAAADGASQVRYVTFPEQTYNLIPARNPEFETSLLRFTYSSLITPNSVIDYHMDTGEWQVRKRDEIPSGHDPGRYTSLRLSAAAPDGTPVPISLVHKKELERDGRNPTLLAGYGSYGSSYDPSFNANIFSLVDRGFVFAIAHVRGGSEMGRAWYEGGKMLNKRNTFTDFIACAGHLIAEAFTAPDKLAIMGGSAGGLLVGAAMNMRPDLFKAVVAKVPFVDVINTMSDPSIPLTTIEYTQWGNPEDPTYFDYMMSYSPYDNVGAVDYPDILLTTGLNDPRVAYWEPAKFAARLRAMRRDDNLLLLKTNMDAGHAGASGRYDRLQEVAFDYAFLIDRLQ
jgi:oligopeptidase B